MSRKLFSLIIISILVLTQVNSQTWTSLNGPWRVGNGKDITVGYANSTRVLYLADSSTNLKKSTNGGTSWGSTGSVINNPIAVACNPSVASRLYVADAGNIRTSLDGGSSFSSSSVSNLQPYRFGVSSADSNKVFLGTLYPQSGSVHATLYFTTNGGTNWATNNFFFNNNLKTHILGIACHPTDGNKMWAGGSAVKVVAGSVETPNEDIYYDDEIAEYTTMKKGVWYNDEGGTTDWHLISEEFIADKNISAVAVMVSGGTTTVFAGTADHSNDGGELWKTTDNGTAWTKVFDRGGGSITFIAVNSSNNRIYVGHNKLGMSYSFDNGANWYHDSSATTHDAMFDWDVRGIAVHSSDSNDVFAVSRSSAFSASRSSAGLIDWQDKNTNISIVPTTSVSAKSSTVLAVGTTFSGIARYTPSGGWRTWRASVTNTDGPVVEPNGVLFDPFGADKGIVAGRQKVSTSAASTTYDAVTWFNEAGGTGNWKQAYHTLAHYSDYTINAFVADPKEKFRRYGLGKVKDGSTEYSLIVSADSGRSWNVQSSIGGENNPGLCMVVDSTGGGTSTSQILYASVSGKGIYKSTDAGTNWTSSFVSSYKIRSLALNTTSPSTIYASGDVSGGNGLWKSTNSGSSWTAKRSDACPRVIMHPSYPTSVNHVWVIGSGGNQIFKTIDGGANWDSVNASALTRPFYDLRADIGVDSVIYLATAAGVVKINPAPEATVGLAYSGSSGQHPVISWTANLESDLSGYKLYKSECGGFQYQLLHIIGSDSSSYEDVTATIGNGSGNSRYYIIAYDNQNNEAAQSSVLSVPCTWNVERAIFNPAPEEELPTHYELSANYPNPFNPVTTIKYALPDDVEVKLTVVDIIGREVAVLVKEKQTAGYKSVEFDATHLASGMYLYKLVAGSFTDVKKMVVAK